MDFRWHLRTEIVFGNGKIKDIPEHLNKFGEKGFISTSLKGLPVLKKFLNILDGAKADYYVFSDVKPNPTSKDVDSASDICKKNKCDYVIGFGGGSSMDFAKAVAVAAGHDKSVINFLTANKNKIEIANKALKIICIPTTHGTGAEVTNGAVITIPDTHEKTWIGDENIIPQLSIVDPELGYSVPGEVAAGCGMDALSHAVEAYVSDWSSPITDIAAEKAITLVNKNLPAVVENGNNNSARENMALASTLAGFAIQVGAMLVHAVGHSLGGRLNMPHGIAMGICMPEVLKLTWSGNIEKFARLSALFNNELDIRDKKEAASLAYRPVEALLKKVGLGDRRLSDFGLKEDMIDNLVDDVFGYLYDFFVVPAPKEVTREDVKKLYKKLL